MEVSGYGDGAQQGGVVRRCRAPTRGSWGVQEPRWWAFPVMRQMVGCWYLTYKRTSVRWRWAQTLWTFLSLASPLQFDLEKQLSILRYSDHLWKGRERGGRCHCCYLWPTPSHKASLWDGSLQRNGSSPEGHKFWTRLRTVSPMASGCHHYGAWSELPASYILCPCPSPSS